MDHLLEMRGITKSFPGVVALSNVNLAVRGGEIHAVVGENGAGKSTLMKVLSRRVSATAPTTGRFASPARSAHFRGIADSERLGISIIHQELALVPQLSIAENIFLGNERARARRDRLVRVVHARRASCCSKVGLNDVADRRSSPTSASASSSWSRSPRRCRRRCALLILDEPTASLNETDSDALLELLLGLKAHGIACILISHKLNEVAKVADTITVHPRRRHGRHHRLPRRPGERARGDPLHGGPRDGRSLPAPHAADRAEWCSRSATGACATRCTTTGCASKGVSFEGRRGRDRRHRRA